MAPVRRYLRIGKYSVLECRIYVENPAHVSSWLLHPRDPALPRVIESVRPLVVPKLKEEQDRARKKNAKKKGAIRDVVVEADFEVSLFLTETQNKRHSLLYKHRRARDKTQTRLVSNSSRLTGTEPGGEGPEAGPIDVDAGADTGGRLTVDLGEDAVHLDADGDDDEIVLTGGGGQRPRPNPLLLREESDEEPTVPLDAIPDIRTAAAERPKRRRNRRQKAIPVRDSDDEDDDDEDDANDSDNDNDDDQESLFLSGDDDADDDADDGGPPAKRARTAAATETETEAAPGDVDGQKKKKIVMDVVYEGFSIYGRVLCLVVKRRGAAAPTHAPTRNRTLDTMLSPSRSSRTAVGSAGSAASAAATTTPAASATDNQPGGFASMENWIASTQMPVEVEEDDDEDDNEDDDDTHDGV